MKRLLTAAVGVPLGLLAVFRLPPLAFFWLVALLLAIAAWEYARIVERWATAAPLWLVVPLTPLVALSITPVSGGAVLPRGLAGVAFVLAVCVPLVVLALRTPVESAMPAMAAIAFGALYIGLPLAALADLQRQSPDLLLLLLAIVWLGDSAAYYVGTRFGRRRLAPVVSPNKSWEGAAASIAASALAVAGWLYFRGEQPEWPLVALALVTSVAAQVGDLVESMIKRGAGVKDSGTLLPGHGGLLDRFDALFFAAPVWWFGLKVLGRLAEQ